MMRLRSRRELLALSGFGAYCVFAQGTSKPEVARGELDIDRTVELLLADDELTPPVLKLEEGRYQFAVHNAFTTSALQLRLDDEKNNRVKEVVAKKNASKGNIVETLKPGKYVLWIAQRPKWRTTIEVTAKK